MMDKSISSEELKGLIDAPYGMAAKVLVARGLWHETNVPEGERLFDFEGEVEITMTARVRRTVTAATPEQARERFVGELYVLDADSAEDWDTHKDVHVLVCSEHVR